MSESVTIFSTPIEIRYNGIYDLDGLYKLIRGWLDEHRYDYMEKVYKDKTGGPFGNEVEWAMIPELKVNGFVKFNIKIETKFYDVKEFEATYDGEKKKVNNGKFWIKINGSVEYDYQGNFKRNFEKKLLNILIKHLFKKYYDIKYVDTLTYSIYDLQTQIKKFIKMEGSSNAY